MGNQVGGRELGQALRRCADAGVATVVCPAIDRDGTRAGPDLDLLREVRDRGEIRVDCGPNRCCGRLNSTGRSKNRSMSLAAWMTVARKRSSSVGVHPT